jgi:uncharacterized membrane protein YqiK
MLGYRVPAPNEALIVSGRKQKDLGSQFRIVTGHGTFVMPIVSRASTLTLSMQEASVIEDCYTQQGLTLGVKAVIAFKVGDDHESISAAARRFQADQSQMPTLVGRIFSGHLRSIIGSMTVESIIRDQQRLGDAIVDASKSEMARIGLTVDSLQISEIDDKGSGYIAALAAPHQAAVNRAARIAQAQADQESAEAQQESDRNQAEYARQTAIARAKYQAQIDIAEEEAAQAGPLAAAKAQQAVLIEQARVAAKNADLRAAELIAEVVKPAEADAQAAVLAAEANAKATKLAAEAAAAQGRIALDQQLLRQMPGLVDSVAQGLQGANVTVLNGASGLNDLAVGMVAQAMAIFEGLRANYPSGFAGDGSADPSAAQPVEPADGGPEDPQRAMVGPGDGQQLDPPALPTARRPRKRAH